MSILVDFEGKYAPPWYHVKKINPIWPPKPLKIVKEIAFLSHFGRSHLHLEGPACILEGP